MTLKCCGMNPRVGVLIIAILGILIHGLVLAWGVYAHKILYIMISAGITVLFYVYLLFPLGSRHHYAYLPFLIFAVVIILGLVGHMGFLVYVQIKWPNYWKTLLVKMLDGIIKDFDWNTVNYVYIGLLMALFLFNLLAAVTVNIAFRYEAQRRTQKLVIATSATSAPYSTLDINGPRGEQLWSVKL